MIGRDPPLDQLRAKDPGISRLKHTGPVPTDDKSRRRDVKNSRDNVNKDKTGDATSCNSVIKRTCTIQPRLSE